MQANYSHISFNIDEKKVCGKFEINGIISHIVLDVKSDQKSNPIEMQIGSTLITVKELIGMNLPKFYQPENKIVLSEPYIKSTFGKNIEVKKGDIFEFRQVNINVIKVRVYFDKL